ncbi:hypothetical protein GOC68_25535 [Sinorhizobium medicae]|nr:hypothetical protein [Sinorhizobium medicae]
MPSFLDGRQIIEPKSLIGPRVYSTDLFPALINANDAGLSVAIASRALKTKLITKGIVTLNSVYLLSPGGIALFENDSSLFEGDGILPAFRDDHSELQHLVERNQKDLDAAGIGGARLDEHLVKLDASIRKVLPWQLADNGELLRQLLISGLEDDNSRISLELTTVGFDRIGRAKLVEQVRDADMTASANVRALMKVEPEAASRLLNAFVTASYHKVGAAVVNCEIGTDLNPLSAYKAADMILAARSADGMARLSEEAIFLDTFAATALAAIQSFVASDSIIDSLDFKAAHRLSEALRAQGFQQEYDQTLSKVLSMTSFETTDVDNIDVEDVTHAVESLHRSFSAAITDQLPNYTTKIQHDAKERLIQVGADLSRDIAGQVPGLSNMISVFDAVQHGKEGVAASWEALTLRDTQKALTEGANKRREKMNTAIDTLYAGRSSKSKLLHGVGAMVDLYVKAIERV